MSNTTKTTAKVKNWILNRTWAVPIGFSPHSYVAVAALNRGILGARSSWIILIAIGLARPAIKNKPKCVICSSYMRVPLVSEFEYNNKLKTGSQRKFILLF